ncbi:MAG: hypothetical protein II871_06420 [Clostridia bacterium]|nr:hypothetical protein [Clostridia bacterium]
MKRSAKIFIVFIAALAILFCSIAIGARGRRAEAMFGGAVLIHNETEGVYAN